MILYLDIISRAHKMLGCVQWKGSKYKLCFLLKNIFNCYSLVRSLCTVLFFGIYLLYYIIIVTLKYWHVMLTPKSITLLSTTNKPCILSVIPFIRYSLFLVLFIIFISYYSLTLFMWFTNENPCFSFKRCSLIFCR